MTIMRNNGNSVNIWCFQFICFGLSALPVVVWLWRWSTYIKKGTVLRKWECVWNSVTVLSLLLSLVVGWRERNLVPMGSGVVGVWGRRCGYCRCRNELERKRGKEDENGGCGGRWHVDGGELISLEIHAPSPLIMDMPPRIKNKYLTSFVCYGGKYCYCYYRWRWWFHLLWSCLAQLLICFRWSEMILGSYCHRWRWVALA